MSIQEAIKSGKPFRVPGMTDYLYVKKHESHYYCFWLSTNKRCLIFPIGAILSNNWETKTDTKLLQFPKKHVSPSSPIDPAS